MKSDSRVQMNDVTYTYEEQAAPALSGVSAVISPGEFVAVLEVDGTYESFEGVTVNRFEYALRLAVVLYQLGEASFLGKLV